MSPRSQPHIAGDGLKSALMGSLHGEHINFAQAEGGSGARPAPMIGPAGDSVDEIRALAQRLHDELVASNATFRAWLALKVALDALDAAWPTRSGATTKVPTPAEQGKATRRATTHGASNSPPAGAEPPRRTIAEAALAALKHRRRPMTTAELVDAMQADGAEHAAASVSSTLSQNPHFRSLRWNGAKRWWPAQLRAPREPGRPEDASVEDEV